MILWLVEANIKRPQNINIVEQINLMIDEHKYIFHGLDYVNDKTRAYITEKYQFKKHHQFS